MASKDTIVIIQEPDGSISQCSYVSPESGTQELMSSEQVTEIILDMYKDAALKKDQTSDDGKATQPSSDQLLSLLQKITNSNIEAAPVQQHVSTTEDGKGVGVQIVGSQLQGPDIQSIKAEELPDQDGAEWSPDIATSNSNELGHCDVQTAVSNLKLDFSFGELKTTSVASTSIGDKDHPKEEAQVLGVPNLKSREGGPYHCSFCLKVFNVPMSLEVHELSHYNAHKLCNDPKNKSPKPKDIPRKRKVLKPFVCKVCEEPVADRKRLGIHMLDKHNIDYFYTCRCCRLMYLDCAEYTEHEQSEEHRLEWQQSQCEIASHPKEYLCSTCGAGFIHKISLTNHQKSHLEPSQRQVQCPHCPFKAKSRHGLAYHLTAHHEQHVFKCPECPYSSPFLYNLRRHGKSHLKSKAALVKPLDHHCRQCDAKFEKMYELRLHATNVHNSSARFFCTKCDFYCQQNKTYYSHLLVHKTTKLNYKCTQCDFVGLTATGLTSHMASHSEERPYACDKCPARYKAKNPLRRHVLFKHSSENSLRHKCDECSYSTATRGELYRHIMYGHAETKKHSCHMCDYKTNYYGNLTKHVTACHGSTKPFSCPQCSYKGSLKQHVRAHLRRFHKVVLRDGRSKVHVQILP